MASKNSKNNKTSHRERERLLGIETTDQALAVIFILAVVLLPLLIRVHTGQFIAPGFIADPVNTGIRGEVFSYYKSIFLYLLAIISTLLILQKMLVYRWEIPFSYINIPLVVLAVTILLSGILAEFKGIALYGMYNRCEGSLTWLAYLLLFFAAATTSYKPWFERFIKYGLGLVLLINVIIILFHFYGHDLFQVAAVKTLLIPAGLENVDASGTLWSTLNNPNYVSGFAAALTAFFLALAIGEKDRKPGILWATGSILAFTMMLASLSTSGWVALALTLPLLVVIAGKNRNRKAVLHSGAMVLGGWILVFLLLNSYNPGVGNEPMNFLRNTLGETINELKSRPQPVDAPAPSRPEGKESSPPADQVSPFAVGTPDEFSMPASGSSAGSGRTYIWKKTLGLIKERPVLGYGLDTLPYYFPQNDPEKIAGLGKMEQIIDKPHSAYLALAYGCGLIALAALLVLLTLYFYYGCRQLFNPAGNAATGFQPALLAFCLAFIIQWLFNDSIIGTSVIFWTLLGISVSQK